MRLPMSDPSPEGEAHPTWREAPLTILLIASCVLVFLGSWGHCLGTGGEWTGTLIGMDGCDASLDLVGGLRLGLVWERGEWWRVVSAGLAHGSWLHLALNMWSLWVVGPWAERAWGRGRTLLLFALASIGGCLASAAWVEAPMVVGASAGIIGLAGAVWLGRVLGASEVRARLEPVSARGLGIMLLILVGLGFAVPMVAQAGHLGGLVVGLALGAAVSLEGPRSYLGVAAAVGCLGLFGWGAADSTARPRHAEFRGFFLLAEDEPASAAPWFDAALTARPEDRELQNAVAYALAEASQDLPRAVRLARVVVEADPKNPDYLDTLGWALCRSGVYDEGADWLELAAAADGDEDPVIAGHVRDCRGSAQ